MEGKQRTCSWKVKMFLFSLVFSVLSRFTELYVHELENEGDLRILVSDYLKCLNPPKSVISGIIRSAITCYHSSCSFPSVSLTMNHFSLLCSLQHNLLWLDLTELLWLCLSFYLAARREASSRLVDGTGHRPHYSLRTLCRALSYAAANPCLSVQRSLYEVRPGGVQGCSFLLWDGRRLKICCDIPSMTLFRASVWASSRSWTGAPILWSRSWCVNTS